ncbi:sulfite exporter TauE/SafE family protein [uncultured Imperialibacter sp.]|uniref:sulfite exporter TauE/SafE family protein n=1 Tax=uncultured Imperialibacter sp. TaxID=1672639 RepID=UPI0030D6E0EF|tara:strand:- start:6038 stop:6901 length:864 start_codon:yes stop_codon:yes gene_type:complete
MITIIWTVLVLLAIWIAVVLFLDYLKHRTQLEGNSWTKTGLIGLVGNFFDTLGIGSFAIETALLKFMKQTEDRLMPGTLNVGNAIPTMAQAIIFIRIVEVEPWTLVLMVVASGAGALLGAGIVAKLPENVIRLTMGIALLITAGFMVATKMNWLEGGGEAIGLAGGKLILAVAANFVLGAIMTAGIGLYAPCMALVFALGMSPAVAFPIMMGSCAFLMPMASYRFIKAGAYNRKAAFAIATTGLIGVFIAAFVVKSLELDTLRWVVLGVILYTAAVMLRAGLRSQQY